REHSQSAHNHTRNAAQATNHHHSQVDDRIAETKGVGSNSTQFSSVISACNAREESASTESQEFCVAQINPRRSRGNLIFANSHPGSSKSRVAQANICKNGQRNQRKNQVIIGSMSNDRPVYPGKGRGIDTSQTIDAIRILVHILNNDWHNLTKAKSHYRQVIA